MRFGSVAIAYKEERFIGKHLDHLPDWIEEKLVLNSTKPWQGEDVDDYTGDVARAHGATVVQHDWASEHDQRNAGQDWFHDFDWIIILDPDEFLPEGAWLTLHEFLQQASGQAYVCREQFTYWKKGMRVQPQEDYKQIIAVRPSVRFIDKRVVDSHWGYAPVSLHHFSWARTDEEVWNKISHYGHAHEFDTKDWYENVWLKNKTEDLHPLTPPSLKSLIPATLPPSLSRLDLWP